MVYTSSDILNSVKRNQTIATTGFRFQDSDLLAMVDEEIENIIVPMILRLHSDRLVYTDVLPLVPTQGAYDIPYRAIGGQLRDVILQDSATAPTIKRSLNYLEHSAGFLDTTTGDPTGYYFSGDEVRLVPSTGATTTFYLAFNYAIKHPRLVDGTEVGVILSVDYTTGDVTLVNNAPILFTTANYYDFLVGNPRSKPRIVGYDKQPVSIVANVINFDPLDIPLGLVSGDRLTLAEQTDVLCLPNECYKYLCKAVEIKVMEAQKDLKAVEQARPLLRDARSVMESILSPRVVGQPRVILNDTGLLRRRFSY
jgi:hypothetical protein